MSRHDIAAKCALEWLQCSGARTDERLYWLCEHHAGSYGIPVAEVYARAIELKPEWLRLA